MEHLTAQQVLVGVATILGLGVASQWIAWRVRVPSIVILLLAGFVIGPVTDFLDPDLLLGDLLVPVVSLAVAVILFEGSLGLRYAELRQVGSVVVRLITVGALVTWALATAGARLVLGLDPEVAILLGAILIVTGPTVIIPLLQHVRPTGTVGSVIKWEGIVIDPIGAMVAVLVFEAIHAVRLDSATTVVLVGVVRTIVAGTVLGAAAALALAVLLRRYLIPDHLQSFVTLGAVVIAFTVANALQDESGLLAAVVMGLVLGNQPATIVERIVHFKEELSLLLISSVFVVLAARLRLGGLTMPGWKSLLFLALLVVVVRPLAVALSTWGSSLARNERVFMAAMAPRGIVAAAVSSVFALELRDTGFIEADRLVSETFFVIIGTVVLYGFASGPIAAFLEVARPRAEGVLFVGAYSYVRDIARALQQAGIQVLLVDTNRDNVTAAHMAGLPAVHDSVLSEEVLDAVRREGIGRLVAMTTNDDLNARAAARFARVFGSSEVYRIAPDHGDAATGEVPGRLLFGRDHTSSRLAMRFVTGDVVKATRITERFRYESFMQLYGPSALPMFLLDEWGGLTVFDAEHEPAAKPGQTLVSAVPAAAATSASIPRGPGT